ncbi:MAG: hypothetical protein J6W16_06845 [Methanobrevibacter sp.]|nr:hypothetical protein [Methanobrevibacter sp.]MBP5785281.1 hypothetical protein [Methanobrevibacter sp.]
MKIYRNLYTPYKRYFFFFIGRCFEVHNIFSKNFSAGVGHYNQKEVEKDTEHFPVVGEIENKDIVKLVLGKIKETDNELC